LFFLTGFAAGGGGGRKSNEYKLERAQKWIEHSQAMKHHAMEWTRENEPEYFKLKKTEIVMRLKKIGEPVCGRKQVCLQRLILADKKAAIEKETKKFMTEEEKTKKFNSSIAAQVLRIQLRDLHSLCDKIRNNKPIGTKQKKEARKRNAAKRKKDAEDQMAVDGEEDMEPPVNPKKQAV
jgi:hypothetical protein